MHMPFNRSVFHAWVAALIGAGWLSAINADASPKAAAQPRPAAWTETNSSVVADLQAGEPLVVLVEVPLCANSQIHCGGGGAGDPASPTKNLYWGRGFGVRRYFDESARGWHLIARSEGSGTLLEQAVYAREFSAERFGLGTGRVEELLVLRAVHGEAIESAVDNFYEAAARGAHVSFEENGVSRNVRVHVAGYAGHNRLMDGYRLKQSGDAAATGIPAFVIACKSAPYFSAALESIGATPLVMTRDLVAPEGYVIEALANALGENAPIPELRRRVVSAYARWQRIPERVAGTIFTR